MLKGTLDSQKVGMVIGLNITVGIINILIVAIAVGATSIINKIIQISYKAKPESKTKSHA